MVLCQASQEAALHAHRVGSTESTGIDLVCCLLRGRAEGGENVPQNTVFVITGAKVEELKAEMDASWGCEVEGRVVLVAKDDSFNASTPGDLVGAFSPVVLSNVPMKHRRRMCKVAICVVYNYYGLELEEDDVEDIVEVMCYRVELSTLPLTTREGMLSRGLGWMETLMACDYTKLPQLTGSGSRAHTATSAAMCANFSSV